MQITNISSSDSNFPDQLHDLEAHHKKGVPESINVLGTLPKSTDHLVAIVGTRAVSSYGKQVTYQLASELAKAGAVIVSGLAYGVDSIAHRAALDAGGRTIAVLGTPLNRIYPAGHRGMAMEILATGGALISEYVPGDPIGPWCFTERNRIIAALSRVTIVTESPADSGSLITARDALALGRTVMAVPGQITSPNAAGTNYLIYRGATLVRSATDVIAELGFLAQEAIPVPARSHEEATLLELMKEGVTSNQELIEASGYTAAQFANIISLMEITGKVRNLGAGNWVVR